MWLCYKADCLMLTASLVCVTRVIYYVRILLLVSTFSLPVLRTAANEVSNRGTTSDLRWDGTWACVLYVRGH